MEVMNIMLGVIPHGRFDRWIKHETLIPQLSVVRARCVVSGSQSREHGLHLLMLKNCLSSSPLKIARRGRSSWAVHQSPLQFCLVNSTTEFSHGDRGLADGPSRRTHSVRRARAHSVSCRANPTAPSTKGIAAVFGMGSADG